MYKDLLENLSKVYSVALKGCITELLSDNYNVDDTFLS